MEARPAASPAPNARAAPNVCGLARDAGNSGGAGERRQTRRSSLARSMLSCGTLGFFWTPVSRVRRAVPKRGVGG